MRFHIEEEEAWKWKEELELGSSYITSGGKYTNWWRHLPRACQLLKMTRFRPEY